MADHPSRPLFEAFPALRRRLPFLKLADLPTPLEPLSRLSDQVGAEIWVKRDGLTHPVYGGNKIRKFEFVFGDVLRTGSSVVLTGGGLSSHHTLAAAVIARQLGLRTVCAYYCQPLSHEMRHHLRLGPPVGIEAHLAGDYVGLARSPVLLEAAPLASLSPFRESPWCPYAPLRPQKDSPWSSFRPERSGVEESPSPALVL